MDSVVAPFDIDTDQDGIAIGFHVESVDDILRVGRIVRDQAVLPGGGTRVDSSASGEGGATAQSSASAASAVFPSSSGTPKSPA